MNIIQLLLYYFSLGDIIEKTNHDYQHTDIKTLKYFEDLNAC